jgi:glycosyltransferase involved in cell wall biosynthesis
MFDADGALLVDELHPARRSLRVALVTETYPPEVNGVATTLARTVEGLRQRQHDIQLVRPRQQRHDAASSDQGFHEVLMRGLPVPRYPQLKMGLPAKRELLSLWTMRRPDLVHIATEGPLGWSALQAALRLRLPVSSDFRTNFHAYSKHYGVGWLNKPIVSYLKRFHNQCQVTMVPTRLLLDELSLYGFRNLQVLGRGVDTQRFDPARRSEALRAQWNAGPGTIVLLHVGRIAPEKNLGRVVEAYQEVRRLGIDARLVWVGDGPTRATIAAQVPDAIFCGMQTGDALAAHYASADLFVFPSLTETFGNVTTEAMASGLALVAFDCAAAAQLVRDGVSGVLVPVSDADRFATTVAGWAAAAPDERRRLGHAARQVAIDNGWDSVLNRLEATLLAVADTGHSPATLAGAGQGLRGDVTRPRRVAAPSPGHGQPS